MYKLTLTKTDREAIDRIGTMYFHGDQLADELLDCDMDVVQDNDDDVDADELWNEDGDITFLITERIALNISDGLESEDSFCTSLPGELVQKFRDFCVSIDRE